MPLHIVRNDITNMKVDAIASIIRAQQLDRVICFCNT